MGGHDLLNWDTTTHNVTLKSMAAGLEETSVQGLISPPSGNAHLLSVVSDIGGKSTFIFHYTHAKFLATPRVPPYQSLVPYHGIRDSVLQDNHRHRLRW
jgi:hypothetical protein